MTGPPLRPVPLSVATRGSSTRPVVAGVRPEPDPAVLAAIVVAVEQCWPRLEPAAGRSQPATAPWRFSGRWWARPTALRRERPFAFGSR